jgi:hypothetical protein
MTDIILLIVIILQSAYIFYQHKSAQDEREKLQLKLMSKDVTEYKDAIEPTPKEMEEQPNPFKPLEDIPIEDQLKAEDKI